MLHHANMIAIRLELDHCTQVRGAHREHSLVHSIDHLEGNLCEVQRVLQEGAQQCVGGAQYW